MSLQLSDLNGETEISPIREYDSFLKGDTVVFKSVWANDAIKLFSPTTLSSDNIRFLHERTKFLTVTTRMVLMEKLKLQGRVIFNNGMITR